MLTWFQPVAARQLLRSASTVALDTPRMRMATVGKQSHPFNVNCICSLQVTDYGYAPTCLTEDFSAIWCRKHPWAAAAHPRDVPRVGTRMDGRDVFRRWAGNRSGGTREVPFRTFQAIFERFPLCFMLKHTFNIASPVIHYFYLLTSFFSFNCSRWLVPAIVHHWLSAHIQNSLSHHPVRSVIKNRRKTFSHHLLSSLLLLHLRQLDWNAVALLPYNGESNAINIQAMSVHWKLGSTS